MNRFGWPRPPRSFLDTRQRPRVYASICDLAEGMGDALRAYPRRLATGLLLDSPWILGDCERGGDRISASGDTRRLAVYL